MLQKSIIGFCFIIAFFTGCEKDGASKADPGSIGTGGSTARFTIVGNYLYVVDYGTLKTFDISNPNAPVAKPDIYLQGAVETIFPYKDKLFIGLMQGMYVYSLADPAAPVKLGSVMHLRSCDPVVANDSISYVTLQNGSNCGAAEPGLYIYDIKTIMTPTLKKMVLLSNPMGLGLADSVVFVCRLKDGLTAVNVKNPANPIVMYTKKDGEYMDVIPYNGLLICYVRTGIIIYDASDLKNITKLSTISN